MNCHNFSVKYVSEISRSKALNISKHFSWIDKALAFNLSYTQDPIEYNRRSLTMKEVAVQCFLDVLPMSSAIAIVNNLARGPSFLASLWETQAEQTTQ